MCSERAMCLHPALESNRSGARLGTSTGRGPELLGRHPVFRHETRNSLKFTEIVGDEDESFAPGVRRNVKVVDTNRLPRLIQGSADRTVVAGRLGRVGQRLQQARKLFDHSKILRDLAALSRNVQLFAQGDGRHRQAPGVVIEHTQHFDRPTLDDLGDDVGVQQVLEHSVHTSSMHYGVFDAREISVISMLSAPCSRLRSPQSAEAPSVEFRHFNSISTALRRTSLMLTLALRGAAVYCN